MQGVNPDSQLLYDESAFCVTMLRLAAGQELPEHRSRYPIAFQVLTGEGELVVSGHSHALERGAFYSLAIGEPHIVRARTEMVLLHTEDKSGARNAPGRAIRPTEPIESAGRNHPLETLLEAHRRNEQFLRVLQLLVQQPPGGRLESHELSALELALRYFAESRPLHHLDEEESIFPRLEGTALEGKIRQLAREHEHLDGLHAGLGAQLQAWVAQGRLEAGQRRAMQATLRELVNVLRQHRMVEEEEIFPFAKQSFSAAVWARIDQEFAARRK